MAVGGGGGCCVRTIAPFLMLSPQQKRVEPLFLSCNGFLGVLSQRRYTTKNFVACVAPLCFKRRFMCSLSQGSSPSDLGTDVLGAEDDDDGGGGGVDPVASFLAHFHSTPLAQLAKQLPDGVIEGLEGGLKRHLERFPTRYRLFRAPGGILHVQRMREDFEKFCKARGKPVVTVVRKNTATSLLHLAAGRFVTLESLVKLSHMTHRTEIGDASGGSEEMKNTEENTNNMEFFLREHLLPAEGVELWLLTAEYTLGDLRVGTSSAEKGWEEAMGITGDAQMRGASERKEVLQAFRWVRLLGVEMVDEAVDTLRTEAQSAGDDRRVHTTDGSSPVTLRRSTLYVRYSVPAVGAGKGKAEVADGAVGIEEYNVYRMCRALDTQTFVKLPELQAVVGDCLTQPLSAILAVAGEEKRQIEVGCDSDKTGRSILDFERDPTDATRIVGVRFWLDEARYLPSLYLEKSHADLKEKLVELNANMPKNMSKLPNHKRVRLIETKRLLMRCIALHELGPSPLCHPDVLAYYVFDTLPLDGQLIMAGHLPQLLTDDIRRITDARSRSWMRAYPHLFRLVEQPPELFVQRMDATPSCGSCDKQEQQQQQETAPISLDKPGLDYHKQLLNDPEEQLRFVVSIVATRLDMCRSKKLLPSHIPKFMDAELRRKIIPRRSGGILRYLERYPDVFILTYGDHPNEPVVTLVSSLCPNPEHGAEARCRVKEADARGRGGVEAME